MFGLRRFKELADSYGGDLLRWPAEVQDEARKLLDTDPDTRKLLIEARTLDVIIEGAAQHEEAVLWQAGERQAALARVRAGVASQIAPPVPRRLPEPWLLGWRILSDFGSAGPLLVGRFGLATGTGLAVAMGLLIGSLYAAGPIQDDVTALLQPAPIHFLAD